MDSTLSGRPPPLSSFPLPFPSTPASPSQTEFPSLPLRLPSLHRLHPAAPLPLLSYGRSALPLPLLPHSHSPLFLSESMPKADFAYKKVSSRDDPRGLATLPSRADPSQSSWPLLLSLRRRLPEPPFLLFSLIPSSPSQRLSLCGRRRTMAVSDACSLTPIPPPRP